MTVMLHDGLGDPDGIRARFLELKLPDSALRMIDRALPGARLVTGGAGRSRVGGLPDLPPETGWPIGRAGPMHFIAQIDLAELRAACPGGALPPRGLLSFFVDFGGPWRWTEPGNRVLFHDLPPDSCGRRTPPPGPERRRLFGLLKTRDPVRIYREIPVGFQSVLTVPNDLPRDLSDEQFGALSELNHGHRMLGHPYVIQNPMDEELARRTGVPGPDWRLLLQVDSAERGSDMAFGDSGILYYWIPAEDAPAGRFDRVVTLVQFC